MTSDSYLYVNYAITSHFTSHSKSLVAIAREFFPVVCAILIAVFIAYYLITEKI